jgi:hypothetical protein
MWAPDVVPYAYTATAIASPKATAIIPSPA